MAKKSAKLIASLLVSTIIISNTLFVYANDNVVAFHFLLCDTLSDNDKEKDIDLGEYAVRASFLRPQLSIDDDKNKYKVVSSKKEKDDAEDDSDVDFTLNLLEMDLNQYKQELKNGEDLRSLLTKNEKTEEYDNKAFTIYKDILQKAVNTNAITQEEMSSLLEQYIINTSVVNNL